MESNFGTKLVYRSGSSLALSCLCGKLCKYGQQRAFGSVCCVWVIRGYKGNLCGHGSMLLAFGAVLCVGYCECGHTSTSFPHTNGTHIHARTHAHAHTHYRNIRGLRSC